MASANQLHNDLVKQIEVMKCIKNQLQRVVDKKPLTDVDPINGIKHSADKGFNKTQDCLTSLIKEINFLEDVAGNSYDENKGPIGELKASVLTLLDDIVNKGITIQDIKNRAKELPTLINAISLDIDYLQPLNTLVDECVLKETDNIQQELLEQLKTMKENSTYDPNELDPIIEKVEQGTITEQEVVEETKALLNDLQAIRTHVDELEFYAKLKYEELVKVNKKLATLILQTDEIEPLMKVLKGNSNLIVTQTANLESLLTAIKSIVSKLDGSGTGGTGGTGGTVSLEEVTTKLGSILSEVKGLSDYSTVLADIKKSIDELKEKPEESVAHQNLIDTQTATITDTKSITFTVVEGTVDVTTPDAKKITYPVGSIQGASFSNGILKGDFVFDSTNGKVLITYLDGEIVISEPEIKYDPNEIVLTAQLEGENNTMEIGNLRGTVYDISGTKYKSYAFRDVPLPNDLIIKITLDENKDFGSVKFMFNGEYNTYKYPFSLVQVSEGYTSRDLMYLYRFIPTIYKSGCFDNLVIDYEEFTLTHVLGIEEGIFTNTKGTELVNTFVCSMINGISSLPSDLLSNFPNLEYVGFGLDTSIELYQGYHPITLPHNLFENNKKIHYFNRAFTNMPLIGETPYVMIDGVKTKLWELEGKSGYPDKIDGTDCFKGCDKLDDWEEIPESWGGPKKQVVTE